ncbi:MAG: hypothetical protein NTY02_08865 [Acidobacteria bacterium]|nr:hypothetical protein [Acidobacteriota bacterium]
MKHMVTGMMAAATVLGSVVLLATGPAYAQEMTMGEYEGRWELQANGDVKVTRKFTLPMIMYNQWKLTNVHMAEFRSLAGSRSTIEVTDKKYEWDDVNRTLTLSMTVLGLPRNMGDHWEAKMVGGLSFSNLDENKKTAFFHSSGQSPAGKFEGRDVVVFPGDATKIEWNAGANALMYRTPSLDAPTGLWTLLWWTLAGLCALAGIAMWGMSFVRKPVAT